MKAWSCCDYNAEIGVIVFADTRAQARATAQRQDGLEDCEWTNIDVRRLPAMDGKRGVRGALDWRKDAVLYYDAKFRPEEGAHECNWCGRYEFSEIPESRVTAFGDDDMCAGCLAAEKHKAEQDAS
jgi:hypothetical protein